MARTIQTYVNDLRITEKDKGCVLTVNDNYNVEWAYGPSQTAGEVWQYTKIEKDCFIVLPRADLHQGYCVAILRGNFIDPITNKERPAGVVIVPYDKNNSIDGLDIIQGQPKTFYISAGVAVNSANNTIIYGQEDNDDYSSVIFKSINISTDPNPKDNPVWSWVIVNGVGTWNGETLNYELYKNIINQDNQVIVPTQTAGVNTLTAGLQTANTEFNEIITTSNTNYSVITNDYLSPLNKLNDVSNYFIGSFQGETTYFSDLNDSTINCFGPTPSNIVIENSGITFNSINTKVNFYLKPAGFEQSYTYNLRAEKRTFNSTNSAVIQIPFNIDISKIRLKDEKTITEPRNLYAIIQNYSDNQYDVDTFVYKLPVLDSTAKPILLKSSLSGFANNRNGIGTLVTIPITENDIKNNIINFAIEFIVNSTDVQSIENLNIGVNYIQLKFFGLEQITAAELSPEVDFENFGYADCNNIGDLYEDGQIKNIVDNCYIDANTNVGIYFGGSLKEKTEGSGILPIFNDSNRYRPKDNVTKTILEYKNKYSRLNNDNVNDDGYIESTLIIDWAKSKYQFTSLIRTGQNSLQHASAGTFTDFSDPDFKLKYYYGEDADIGTDNSEYIYFNGCLDISSEGLAKFPYYCYNSIEGIKNFSFVMNITNYKTMTNNMEGNLTQPPMEVLCHYKCGWEVAEGKWTTIYNPEGFEGCEWDALAKANGEESPSKKCIILPHKRQSDATKDKTNPNDMTFDDEVGLLPYIAPLDSKSSIYSERYFSTRFGRPYPANKYNRFGSQSANSSDDGWTKINYLMANDFIYLDLEPTISGTLFVNITIPLGGMGTGYIIFGANYTNNILDENSFRLIKSFNKNSGIDIGETHQFKIEFTDKVQAAQKMRYYIILYTAPTTGAAGGAYEGYNGLIARTFYNPDDGSIIPPDFKTMYDKTYVSTDGYKRNRIADKFNDNTMTQVFQGSTFGRNEEAELPLDFISNLLYGKGKNEPLSGGLDTPHTNWGFTFEFLAYVLRN